MMMDWDMRWCDGDWMKIDVMEIWLIRRWWLRIVVKVKNSVYSGMNKDDSWKYNKSVWWKCNELSYCDDDSIDVGRERYWVC